MPRNYYCSVCGKELHVHNKALKNKQLILSLITPHDCDEAFLSNITDSEKPTNETISFNDSLESKEDLRQQMNFRPPTFTDQRDKSTIKPLTSTAPINVLNQLKAMGSSIPKRSLVDSDLDDEA